MSENIPKSKSARASPQTPVRSLQHSTRLPSWLKGATSPQEAVEWGGEGKTRGGSKAEEGKDEERERAEKGGHEKEGIAPWLLGDRHRCG